MSRTFDAIIVGAGQAGPALAVRLAGAGKKVAIVERHLFGGTCVNTGCTPTKAMVASAASVHAVRRASEYGVRGVDASAVTVDIAVVRARRDGVVGASRKSLEGWVSGTDGVTVFRGHARFTGARTLRVGGDEISAGLVFVNVGGRPSVPSFPGLDKVDPARLLTSDSLLELAELPSHLVVVGGSYVGLEFAQMYRRFGARVTIVEKGHALIGREDDDVSQAVTEVLRGEGIEVRTDATCIRLGAHAHGVEVGVDCQSGAPAVVGSHVLLAVGRRPNTDDLGLDQAGIAVDAHGYITVGDDLQTSVAGVYALGDCNGRGAFTHTAYNDYEIVAANLLDREGRKVSDRKVAYGLYVDPPLGRVGLTEREARATGRKLRIGMRPMTRVGRAREKGETAGFMKIVIDDATDEILGASVLGVGGDEAVHAVLATMYAGGTAKTLTHTVAIHPTVAELLPTIAGEAKTTA